MALKGDLLSADLSNVFQMLALNRKRGLLTVQDRSQPLARRRLCIDGEKVWSADPAPSRPAAALLVESGVLTYAQFCAAKKQAARFNADVVGILRAQGRLRAEDEVACRRLREREHLLEVFLWRDIRFSLDETEPRAAGPDDAPMHVDRLVMEAARRLDEWRHVVESLGSHRDIFRGTGLEGGAPDLPGAAFVVLDAVDGLRGGREIVDETGLSRYTVELSLCALLERGLIEKLAPEDLIGAGDRLSEAGRPTEAIRLWRTALRYNRTDPAIHKRLAGAYLEAERPAKACAHYRFCAGALAAAGGRREALAIHRLVWKLLPTHFATLETILSLIEEENAPLTRDDRACIADARKLLQAYQDVGEHDRALPLAASLRRVCPDDRDLMATEARLCVRLGRADEAVDAWISLAERMREDGDLVQALEVYRTLASFDAAGAKLYEIKIREVKRQHEHELNRRGRRRAGGAAAAGVVIALGVWCVYAWLGDRRVGQLGLRTPSDPAEQEALASDYETTRAWFVLAPAGAKAGAAAKSLFAEARATREHSKQMQDRATADRAERRLEAERLASEGRRLIKVGRLDEAVAALRRIADVAPPKDAGAWSGAAKDLDDVRRYLAQGRALLAEADADEAAHPETAFRKRLRVLRDFELVPEASAIKLSIRIDSAPKGAWLVVNDGAFEGTAPLVVPAALRGTLKIEARAEGCLPRALSLPLPPTAPETTIALEPIATAVAETKEPLAAAAFVGDDRALLAARNGRAVLIDVRTGAVLGRFASESIESQRRAPVVSGDAALLLVDDGRRRILDAASCVERTTVRVAPSDGTGAWASREGWVVADGRSALVRLDRAGEIRGRLDLPEGATLKDAFVRGDAAYVAAGAGGLVVWNLATDARRVVAIVGGADAACGDDGATAWVRSGSVLRSVDLATGDAVATDLGPDVDPSAPLAGPWDLGEGRRLLLLDRRDVLLVFEGRVAARRTLPGRAVDAAPIADSRSGRVAVPLENGWCPVLDAKTLAPVAGHDCDRGARPSLRGGLFVNPRESGRASVVREP